MSILQILYYPDERLRKIAKSVIKIDNNIHRIVYDMFDTLYANKGIGLAATQVDIHKRIIVIDISENFNQNLVLINPELLKTSDKTYTYERCLSIQGQGGFVYRSKKIKIHALNQQGNRFELEAENLLAVCIQHEMDHLVGKLFIDYFSPLKRRRICKKIEK